MYFLCFCRRVASTVCCYRPTGRAVALAQPLGGTRMTIVSLVAIHPIQGVAWDDVQKQLKKT